MNTQKQEEFLKSYQSGFLSYYLKHCTCDDFDSMMLEYVHGYEKKWNQLSENRKDQMRAYVQAIFSVFSVFGELKYKLKDKEFSDEFLNRKGVL